MIVFLVMATILIAGAFLLLQVVGPLILGKPTFSWIRDRSRLDNVKNQIRVARADALAEDAEEDLQDFLDDRIEDATNR